MNAEKLEYEGVDHAHETRVDVNASIAVERNIDLEHRDQTPEAETKLVNVPPDGGRLCISHKCS
jgi:hypothetical protein